MMQNLYFKLLDIILGNELGASFGLTQLKKLENNIKLDNQTLKDRPNFLRGIENIL